MIFEKAIQLPIALKSFLEKKPHCAVVFSIPLFL